MFLVREGRLGSKWQRSSPPKYILKSSRAAAAKINNSQHFALQLRTEKSPRKKGQLQQHKDKNYPGANACNCMSYIYIYIYSQQILQLTAYILRGMVLSDIKFFPENEVLDGFWCLATSAWGGFGPSEAGSTKPAKQRTEILAEKSPAFGKPCFCLCGTRHFRWLGVSEDQIPFLVRVERKFIISTFSVKN